LTFYEKYTKQLTEVQLEKLDLNSDLPDGENDENATSEDQNNIEQQEDEVVMLKVRIRTNQQNFCSKIEFFSQKSKFLSLFITFNITHTRFSTPFA
jgi:hypothetical protein